MKVYKNKIGWFLVLTLVVGGILFLNNKIDEKSVSETVENYAYNYVDSNDDYDNYDDYVDYDEDYTYDDESSGSDDMAAFFEKVFFAVFLTIFHCVFIFIPLIDIFGIKKNNILFLAFLAIRVIFVIYGYSTDFEKAFMIDFIAPFVGAFVIAPISVFIHAFRKQEQDKLLVEDSINDKLARFGYGDEEVLKKGLVEQYKEILNCYNEHDLSGLVKLCSPGIYMKFKSEKDLYDKVSEKLVLSDFLLNDAVINKVDKQGQQLFVDMDITYSCFSYVVDEYESVVRGSKTERKEYTKNLVFSLLLKENIVLQCPNCNASIDEDNVFYCSYCGTAINFKSNEWVLKQESILKEN